MQCLATKNENENKNNVQINPKILSLVYTVVFQQFKLSRYHVNVTYFSMVQSPS